MSTTSPDQPLGPNSAHWRAAPTVTRTTDVVTLKHRLLLYFQLAVLGAAVLSLPRAIPLEVWRPIAILLLIAGSTNLLVARPFAKRYARRKWNRLPQQIWHRSFQAFGLSMLIVALILLVRALLR